MSVRSYIRGGAALTIVSALLLLPSCFTSRTVIVENFRGESPLAEPYEVTGTVTGNGSSWAFLIFFRSTPSERGEIRTEPSRDLASYHQVAGIDIPIITPLFDALFDHGGKAMGGAVYDALFLAPEFDGVVGTRFLVTRRIFLLPLIYESVQAEVTMKTVILPSRVVDGDDLEGPGDGVGTEDGTERTSDSP